MILAIPNVSDMRDIYMFSYKEARTRRRACMRDEGLGRGKSVTLLFAGGRLSRRRQADGTRAVQGLILLTFRRDFLYD